MTPTPSISVIVPTHDRAAQLPTTLAALACQTLPAQAFEVIVVADGCSDDTASVARAFAAPYALVVVEQPHAGLATARNHGVRRATAPLVLFLDDDMEATPEFLAAHLAAHARGPGGVVLGSIPSLVDGPPDDVVGAETRRWWADRTAERARPAHRFTARDLFGGNLSLPRALLDAVGGYDEAFGPRHSAEDYELGVRLLRRHVPVQLVREAESRHHDRPTFMRSVARAEADGRAHVLMAMRHPELLAELPLGQAVPGRLRRIVWELGWSGSWLDALLLRVLRLAVHVAERCRFRPLRRHLAALLQEDAYWRGVRDELGPRDAWERLRGSRPPAPIVREREFDLAGGLAGLDAFLAAEPIDALVLRWRDQVLGRIEAAGAAEALRPVHVHAALLERFAEPVLRHLDAERAIGDTDGFAARR